MFNQPTFRAAAAAAVTLLAACASGGKMAPAVPDAIRAPADQAVSVEALATGVQIYTCGADKDGKFVWTFKAPEAELFDTRRNRIGKHYAGPTWEGNDGSKVVGQVRAQDPGPRPDAIAWLLLSARSNSGTGIFGQVRSIQRIDTTAGRAPAAGCDQAQAGTEARVPYTATYYFYVAKTASMM